MSIQTKIVYTRSLNPWRNQALEEYLYDNPEGHQCILYLWQNQNTVVIGKNQNPWRECRTELLEQEEGKLARRISGGGAVFHDTGNLNFTFLVDENLYDVPRQLEVILKAVKHMGIDAYFSGRNDLLVDGRKFSGNAFSHRKGRSMHHGTILVSVDMSKLTRYLQVSPEKFKSKGIESVQSRVINLSEYRPTLTIEEMADALMISFREVYGGNPTVYYDEEGTDPAKMDQLYEKFSSWDWRYGESPKFDIELSKRFIWGAVDIGLQLQGGKIQTAKVYSDAMDEALIEMLPQALEDQIFRSTALAESIRRLAAAQGKPSILEDLAAWMLEKGF